jgi:hypothetical protein
VAPVLFGVWCELDVCVWLWCELDGLSCSYISISFFTNDVFKMSFVFLCRMEITEISYFIEFFGVAILPTNFSDISPDNYTDAFTEIKVKGHIYKGMKTLRYRYHYKIFIEDFAINWFNSHICVPVHSQDLAFQLGTSCIVMCSMICSEKCC